MEREREERREIERNGGKVSAGVKKTEPERMCERKRETKGGEKGVGD